MTCICLKTSTADSDGHRFGPSAFDLLGEWCQQSPWMWRRQFTRSHVSFHHSDTKTIYSKARSSTLCEI